MSSPMQDGNDGGDYRSYPNNNNNNNNNNIYGQPQTYNYMNGPPISPQSLTRIQRSMGSPQRQQHGGLDMAVPEDQSGERLLQGSRGQLNNKLYNNVDEGQKVGVNQLSVINPNSGLKPINSEISPSPSNTVAGRQYNLRATVPRIPSLEPHLVQVQHHNMNRVLFAQRLRATGNQQLHLPPIVPVLLPATLNPNSYIMNQHDETVIGLQDRAWTFRSRVEEQQLDLLAQRVSNFRQLSLTNQSIALVATGSFIQPGMSQFQDALVPNTVQSRERARAQAYPPGKDHAYVPNFQLPVLSHPQLQFQNSLSVERPSDRLPPQHYTTTFRQSQQREMNHSLNQVEQLFQRNVPNQPLTPGLSEPPRDNVNNEMGYPKISGGSPILGSVRLAKRISHPVKRPSPYSRFPALSRAQHFKSLSSSSLWGSNQTPYYLRLSEIILGIAILIHSQLCMAPLYHPTSPGAQQAANQPEHYYLKYASRNSHFPHYETNPIFDESSYTQKVTDTLPLVEDVQKFFKGVFEVGQFHPQTAIFTLIYMNRYLSRSRLQLTATNWKPLATSCLVVAQKMWDDTPLVNADFHILYPPLELQNINSLERIIVDAMEFDLLINRQIFMQVSFELSTVVESFRCRFYLSPLFSKSNELAMAHLDGLPRNYANALKDRSEKLLNRLYTAMDLDSRTLTTDFVFTHSKTESNALANYGFTHLRSIRFGPFQRITDMVDRLDISRIHSSDMYARNKPEFKKNIMTPEFIDDTTWKYQMVSAGS